MKHKKLSSRSAKAQRLQMSEVEKLKINERITALYPKAGIFYVLALRNCTIQHIHKVGKTEFDLKKRLHSYNSHNAFDPICKWVFVCTDIASLEDDVKVDLGPYLLDDTRLEWAQIGFPALRKLVQQRVKFDAELTKDCGCDVYHYTKKADWLHEGVPDYTQGFARFVTALRRRRSAEQKDKEVTPMPPRQIHKDHHSFDGHLTRNIDNKNNSSGKVLIDSNSNYTRPSSPTLTSIEVGEWGLSFLSADSGPLPTDVDSDADTDAAFAQLLSASAIQERQKEAEGKKSQTRKKRTKQIEAATSKTDTIDKNSKRHPGVYFDRLLQRWVADVGGRGSQRRKTFAIGKYGADKALELAIQWRTEQLSLSVSRNRSSV